MVYAKGEKQMSVYGDRIRRARVARGWSQDELAKRADTTQQTIQRYEAGKREPLAKNLTSLSAALGVTVSYLLGMDSDDTIDQTNLSSDELMLIGLYRSTDARGQNAIMAVAKAQFTADKQPQVAR